MSQSTSVICNHSLNTTSVEVLAQDLSKRLNATIIYGYNWTFFIKADTNEFDYDLEFIEIGKIVIENASVTYILQDENLGKKLFIEEHGIEILDSEVYKIDDYHKELLLDAQNVEYELHDTIGDGDLVGYIYKNHIDLWTVESLSWQYYQRQFLYYLDEEDRAIFTRFRLDNLKWIKLFGGNFMFVFSLEELPDSVEEYFENLLSKAFFETIEKEYKKLLVNVSRYYIAKAYQNKPKYVQERISHKYMRMIWYEINNKTKIPSIDLEYPILFYDDFSDLDSNVKGDYDYFNFVYDGSHIFENELKLKQLQDDYVIKREVAKPINLSNYFKLYSCFVTGFKHYVSTDLELSLQLNQEVFLVREPNNEFDKHAIAVCIMYKSEEGFPSHKVKIGYIGMHENYMLCKLMDNGFKLKSILSKISEKAINDSNYNDALTIEIYLKK
jgi:HIRAN domain